MPHPFMSDDYKKEDAHAWEPEYEEKLKEVIRNMNSTFDQLARVVFKYGILNRVAPEDMARMKARKENGRRVWLRGQTDPKLYWSIMYSAGHLILNSKRDQPVYTGLVGVAYKILLNKLMSNNAVMRFNPEGKNFGVMVGEKIQALAEAELEKRDQKNNHRMIELRSNGMHKKKRSTVIGYHPEGKIILEVFADIDDGLDYDERLKTTAYPWEINPDDFKKTY